jgi:hypothetical protein
MTNSTPIVAMVAVIVASAIRRAERGIVDALEDAGAVTPDNAIDLPLSNWLKQQLFRRLRNAGAVSEGADQKMYLNVVGYAAYRHHRRMRALVAVGLVALVALYFYYRSRNP